MATRRERDPPSAFASLGNGLTEVNVATTNADREI